MRPRGAVSAAVPPLGGALEPAPPRRLQDSRAVHVDFPARAAFDPIRRIGGGTGWYYANWLWRLRGLADVLIGGNGLRPGRRRTDDLAVGDPLDCWEVEALEPDRLLRLVARMKLPGQGWLEFEVSEGDRGCTIRQTAIFWPRGLGGLAYWYLLYPIHRLVFAGMLREIARAGRAVARAPAACATAPPVPSPSTASPPAMR